MNRFHVGLTAMLLCVGCTVPGLSDFEKDKPLACDATHACTEGYQCIMGLCCTPTSLRDYYRDVDGDGYGSTSSRTLACAPPNDLYVTATGDCDDYDPMVHPGQMEACNGKDDNCDTHVDEGLGKGEACTGAGNCMGTLECGTDGGVKCNSPTPQVVYADSDQDTHGTAKASLTICGTTVPLGYVLSSDDCDDNHKNVYPSAPELCDGLDNNCNGTTDEGFDVGATCDPGQGCTGSIACASDGGTRCGYTIPTWYPDEDLDSRGKADAGVVTCTPDAGYVLDGGDCNDGNPFTYAGAPELCDLEDNNCNGMVDEGTACPNPDGGQWVSKNTGTVETFRSVALWGNGGVWVAGANSVLRMLSPGASTFNNLDNQCSGDWYSVWADPLSGSSVLTGTNNALAYRNSTGSYPCATPASLTDTDAKGIYSVYLGGGTLETHAVGVSRSNSTTGNGLWGTEGSLFNSTKIDASPLYDVQGISRQVLFAVGGLLNSPRIYRFKPNEGTSGDWSSEGVQYLPEVVGSRLRGIWVVNPKLAYAVGESSSVLKWNGTTWSTQAGPTLTPKEDLLSVVAFGQNSIYVTTGSGKVLRYSNGTWTPMPGLGTGNPLNDIAGTDPGNLWVVGTNGALLHWPR